MSERDERQQKYYDEAWVRLAGIAQGMQRLGVFPALDIGRVFIAVGLAAISGTHGRQAAADFLRELADETEAEPEQAN